MINFNRRNKLLGLALGAVLLALLSFGIVLISSIQPPPAQVAQGMLESRPAPLIWHIQGGISSMEAHSAEGEIQIKDVIISRTAIRLFYAIKLTSPAGNDDNSVNLPVPVITATSVLPGCDGRILMPISLTTQVQSLGSLADFRIGVIHISGWKDRLGQLISIKVQPTSNKTLTWNLPALQQIDPLPASPNSIMGMYLNNSIENPQVVFNGVTGPDWQRQGAFFWLDKLENPVYSPPLIFIEVEVQDKVTVINQKQYEDIAGPMPEIYNRSDIYSPTPTPPGYTPPAVKTPCQ